MDTIELHVLLHQALCNSILRSANLVVSVLKAACKDVQKYESNTLFSYRNKVKDSNLLTTQKKPMHNIWYYVCVRVS